MLILNGLNNSWHDCFYQKTKKYSLINQSTAHYMRTFTAFESTVNLSRRIGCVELGELIYSSRRSIPWGNIWDQSEFSFLIVESVVKGKDHSVETIYPKESYVLCPAKVWIHLVIFIQNTIFRVEFSENFQWRDFDENLRTIFTLLWQKHT